MSVEKHIAENFRLIASIGRLDDILAGEFPNDPEALATARWDLTRNLLLYFTKQHTLAVQPLMRDLRPEAVLAGSRAAVRLQRLHDMFDEQVGSRFARPTRAKWRQARQAVRANLAQVRSTLMQDRDELFRFLPLQPGPSVPTASKTNFTAQAWEFREKLFPHRN